MAWEALRLFEAYRAVQAASLATLKSDIAKGMTDVRAGRVGTVDMKAIKSRGRATMKRKASA